MSVRVSTRTVHTLEIDVPDDALSNVEVADEVEVVLVSRFGATTRHRLSYRDLSRLLADAKGF